MNDEHREIAEKRKRTGYMKILNHLDDIELPEVDYSGYTKHELVETLGLLIENRPYYWRSGMMWRRLKILFYKKLKSESEEREKKNLS